MKHTDLLRFDQELGNLMTTVNWIRRKTISSKSNIVVHRIIKGHRPLILLALELDL